MTIRHTILIPFLFLFTACAATEIIMPRDTAQLEEYRMQYRHTAKQCNSPSLSLIIYTEYPLKHLEYLWRRDALIEVTIHRHESFPQTSLPIVFTLYDKIKRDAKGRRQERTFSEIFLVESFVSEKDLMPLSIPEILKGQWRKIFDKLRNIFPDRDMRVGQYDKMTRAISTAYLNLVDTCILEFHPSTDGR